MHSQYRPHMAHPYLSLVPSPARRRRWYVPSTRVECLLGCVGSLWLAWRLWHSSVTLWLTVPGTWWLLVQAGLLLCCAAADV